MISLILFSLAVLWIAALHQYPSLFVPRKSTGQTIDEYHFGDEVDDQPKPRNMQAPPMRGVAHHR
jgi:hypothetical protein